eukprot:scaffold79414_cov30-Tisochrysis_lutea.AAC.6
MQAIACHLEYCFMLRLAIASPRSRLIHTSTLTRAPCRPLSMARYSSSTMAVRRISTSVCNLPIYVRRMTALASRSGAGGGEHARRPTPFFGP